MYFSAEGMMIVAKAVITGHHCGSFQSVQKSQSPANSCLVMSAAPATTKMAVIQKTKSHLPSIHLYFFCNGARSSSRRCASANAAGVVAAAITLSLFSRCAPVQSATACGRDGVTVFASSSAFSISNKRRIVSPHTANIPEASHPQATKGQVKGTAKNSSEIQRLCPHSLKATSMHSRTAAVISKKNDHGKPLSRL